MYRIHFEFIVIDKTNIE